MSGSEGYGLQLVRNTRKINAALASEGMQNPGNGLVRKFPEITLRLENESRFAAGAAQIRTRCRPTFSSGVASTAMQDLTMLVFTAIFFGLAFLYVKACQKLR